MGSVRLPASPARPRAVVLARSVDLLVGGALLLATLPVMAVLALAVRTTSTGPILRRERTRGRHGRPVELLSFRTTIDGGNTAHHRRVRAVVGAQHECMSTGVGRVLRATRADRLPRLLNVVRGDVSLL